MYTHLNVTYVYIYIDTSEYHIYTYKCDMYTCSLSDLDFPSDTQFSQDSPVSIFVPLPCAARTDR